MVAKPRGDNTPATTEAAVTNTDQIRQAGAGGGGLRWMMTADPEGHTFLLDRAVPRGMRPSGADAGPPPWTPPLGLSPGSSGFQF